MTRSPDLPDQPRRAIPHEARLFPLVAAHIRDMVVFVDLDGRIQWVNDAVEKQFGYALEELIGAHIYTLQAPGKNPPGIWSPGGAGELLEKWAGVIIDRRMDGSEFPASVQSFIVRDEQGSAVGIASIGRDISEMVRAEEALLASEKKYRDLFNESNDAIFIANTKTRMLVDCNRKAEELTGYSRQEILAMRADQLHPGDAAGEAMEAFRSCVAGARAPVMSEILTRDKKTLWVAISPAAVTIGGEACIMGVFRDMSELKDYQRALEERNRELEIISSAAFTREFRIKELRDEVRALKERLAGVGGGA